MLVTWFVLLQNDRLKNHPCSGLSNLSDTRSREVHTERERERTKAHVKHHIGQRHR